MVYEPGEDSFLLRDKILEYFRGERVSVAADIGTGSGIIALALSSFSGRVFACDIDEEAIRFVKEKIVSSSAGNIKVFKSDLFKGFPSSLKKGCDLIVFNPPYLPLGEDDYFDKALHGGKNGVEVTILFLEQAKGFLSKKGVLFFVASSTSGISLLEKKMKEQHYNFEVIGKQHFFFEDILVYRAWL
jgi:HemK-related putative methylase